MAEANLPEDCWPILRWVEYTCLCARRMNSSNFSDGIKSSFSSLFLSALTNKRSEVLTNSIQRCFQREATSGVTSISMAYASFVKRPSVVVITFHTSWKSASRRL